MPEDTAVARRPVSLAADDAEIAEFPTFGDVARFVYQRRVRLFLWALVFLLLGVATLAAWHLARPRIVEGRLLLSFAGLERREYPSGAPFDTEDIRAPDVLRAALRGAGLEGRDLDLNSLAANVQILPVIPAAVLARWRKADRDGVEREDFSPSEFELLITTRQLQNADKLRLFDALVDGYRDMVKRRQRVNLRLVSAAKLSAEDLVTHYDPWDIPQILSENTTLLSDYLDHLVVESAEYQDPVTQYSFRDLSKELSLWTRMRLEPLKAVTYRRQLVRDKGTALLAAQYRASDLAIQSERLTAEEASALRLLEAAQKPTPLAVTDVGSREGIPIVDQPVLDRLMAGEYLAPLVQRISGLQQKIQKLEIERLRLERDIELLPGAPGIAADQLPADYHVLLATGSTELRAIVDRYNRLLDSYTSAIVDQQVTVTAGPRIARGGGSPMVLMLVLVASALSLALLALWIEHGLRKLRRHAAR